MHLRRIRLFQGHMRLVSALAKFYSILNGRHIDPNSEVMITVGAYEALFCAIQSTLEPGDEAIIIEPFFDSYEPLVRTVGGVPRFIALKNVRIIFDLFHRILSSQSRG